MPENADNAAGPTSETGVYLHQHEHVWRYIGAKGYPDGSLCPVYRCEVCTDEICDLHVDVSGRIPPIKEDPCNS